MVKIAQSTLMTDSQIEIIREITQALNKLDILNGDGIK